MKGKDYTEKCGVEVCLSGLQCLKDNGYTKYCTDCLCRTCLRGKCHNQDGTMKVRRNKK